MLFKTSFYKGEKVENLRMSNRGRIPLSETHAEDGYSVSPPVPHMAVADGEKSVKPL